jgi:hypothetical protein
MKLLALCSTWLISRNRRKKSLLSTAGAHANSYKN